MAEKNAEAFLKQRSAGEGGFLNFISKWGTLIVTALLIIFFAAAVPSFLTGSNIVTIFRSISIVTIIAIGVTVSLTVNGFDLSVGSVATFADALVVSMFVWYNMPTWLGMILALLISMVVGLVNAFFIVKLKIPDMLVTLSTMFIFAGVAMTYTGGGSISVGMPRLDGTPTVGKIAEFFKDLGKAPWIIIIMVVVVLLVHIFLNYTKHGRYLYVVGGNMEAARLSGIPVNKYRTLAYMLSSLLSAVGGILIAARIGSAQIAAGDGYLMPAVAAAYIGFSVAGVGKPNAIGTFIGAVLVGILENGLVMMSVPYYSLNIIKGMVLVLALALTYFRKK